MMGWIGNSCRFLKSALICFWVFCLSRSSSSSSFTPIHRRAGPSELQSFSESWRSRFSSMSMKYEWLHSITFILNISSCTYFIFFWGHLKPGACYICSCAPDIKNRSQRIHESGRRDCFLEVLQCRMLVLLGESQMLELLVYLTWWNIWKLEKIVELALFQQLLI